MIFRKILAGVLFASVAALFVSKILASESQNIYTATFQPSTSLNGNIAIAYPNGIEPFATSLIDRNGKEYAVGYKIEKGIIKINSIPASVSISGVRLIYGQRISTADFSNADVTSDGRKSDGSWRTPEILLTGSLADVTDSLYSGIAGAADTHMVGFTTSSTPISDSGVIYVIFPQGFGINGITGALYSDNDPANNSNEPQISSIGIEGNSAKFYLDSGSTPAAPGSRISVKFWLVNNSTVSGNYNVIVMTTKTNGEVENGPAPSNPFAIIPGPLNHVAIVPDQPMTLRSDSVVQFTASGYDLYNNSISGLNFIYDVTIDSCGDISFGAFRALKLGTCKVIVSAGGKADTSGLLTIIPGRLTAFEGTGYPSQTTAGHPFTNNVVVTARDVHNNKKYDYTDSIWFFSGYSIDVFPCTEDAVCHFQSADSGKISLPGAGFILKRAGVTRITATNGSVSTQSDPIRVNPDSIRSFTLNVTTPQTAGVPFAASVSVAVDSFGNSASGTVVITDSTGGGNSPDGYAPSYNNIIVSDGTGSANQTVVNATTTQLYGVVQGGSASDLSPLFVVNPGTLARFNMINEPDSITAGAVFPNSIDLSAFDGFGNLKTNYTGFVHFTSTDPGAYLQFNSSNPYQFSFGDQGHHPFPGSAFRLRTTGQRTITAIDNSISRTSRVIAVRPAPIDAFTLSDPGTVTAGIPFSMTASSCRDSLGNFANGAIIISDYTGGGNSPNGIPPTHNNIIVNNGQGTASQTLVNAVLTRLRGAVSGGNDTVYTLPFTVLPGSLDHFNNTGYPPSTVAGDTLPHTITVETLDAFGNRKTNYDGFIYFTSTDGSAILPYTSGNNFHFLSTFQGIHLFSTEAFSLHTTGQQRISVTDGTRTTPSDLIAVSPDNIVSFALSAPITVTAGTAFTLTATACRDAFNNLANGEIAISDSVGGGNAPDGTPPAHNNIIVSNGTGTAQQIAVKTIPTMLKGVVVGGSARRGSNLFTVLPGALNNFGLSGYPLSTVAGDSFQSPVSVIALDRHDNIKTDYNGSVYFASSDPSATLPYYQGHPYQFISGDSGQHNFGRGFILRQAGVQVISITDGSITETSDSIVVTTSRLTSFSLRVTGPVVAGIPFRVDADTCLDSFGNPAHGIINISVSSGGGNSPDGIAPVFNYILVDNGHGYAYQTLTNAVSTSLRGQVQDGSAYYITSPFNVLPGTLSRFTLENCPQSITAGNLFPDSIGVGAYDNLGNLKTDYLGQIYFQSTDPNASLPYNYNSRYQFTSGDRGHHNFSGFRLTLAGSQTISVTDGVLTRTSPNIVVSPDIIASFSLSGPDTVMSGIPFNITARDCQDTWGNRSGGTIVITADVGGGNAPDGSLPIYNYIVVQNDSGMAAQTMMKNERVRLRGTVLNGSATALTNYIYVKPGVFDHFRMAGLPNQTVAGDTLDPITVTVYDIHSNIKIDYHASVFFTSTDQNALLPYFDEVNSYSFVYTDSGSHRFDEPFSLRTAGQQTITITDGSRGEESPIITVSPDTIVSFQLSSPDGVTSGIPFVLRADNCRDYWNNLGSGRILVSASMGGNPAPDGLPPVINNINVSGGAGSATQTMMKAEPVILHGVLEGDTANASTSMFTVRPGTLDHFAMSGFPSVTEAGDTLPMTDTVLVTVLDSHNNRKTDYRDSIYFESTDNGATLPFTESSPYICQPDTDGSYAFTGPFALYHVRTGGQIISITDGLIRRDSPTIQVTPAGIYSYNLGSDLIVMSGEPFHVTINNCRDRWDNETEGVITISAYVGGGPSPDGTWPILNSVQVNNGYGTALQTLFASETTVLQSTADTVIRYTDSIYVRPAALSDFNFSLSSPQTVGTPFTDTAVVTAIDRYGNIKYNFDASSDTVIILSSADGDMTNNIFNRQGSFTNGILDLVAAQTAYSGTGGPMTFEARSQSGISGYSAPVFMNALFCENLTIEQAQVSPGDVVTGSIVVNNLGGERAVITSLAILDSLGPVWQPISTPSLPDTIAPGGRQDYAISLEITTGWSIGLHNLTASVQGAYPVYSVADTLDGFPETLDILSASAPQYISGSLSPETLSTENVYSIAFRIRNVGHSGLALNDTSYFQFTDGAHVFKANLISAVYLPPDSSHIVFAFDSTQVNPNFIAGSYQGSLHYFGTENGYFLSGILPVSDTVVIQRRASLQFVDGSLSADTIVQAQNISFSARISNEGGADFYVRHQATQITFGGQGYEYIAYSDTTPGNRIDVIRDTVTFHFASVILPSFFPTGRYQPRIIIDGVQNGHNETIIFDLSSDSVAVISRAAIVVNSTHTLSLNAPFVNISQPCSVAVIVGNPGDEVVQSFYIHLSSDGQSTVGDSIPIDNLSAHDSVTAMFHINASAVPESLEVFMSRVSGGIGRISGNPAIIGQPRDNSSLLIVETPAQLTLSPLEIVGPPEALDDTISVGQAVTISATVRNLGQAATLGGRILRLDLGSSGFVADSIYRHYEYGIPNYWTIIAPANPIEYATISVWFDSIPNDANNGAPAVDPGTNSAHSFCVNTAPMISQRAAITAPDGARDGLLSTGQMLIVTDSLNLGGIFDNPTAALIIPQGFATDDPLVQHLTGNVTSWHVRIPPNPLVDTIVVASWVYDVNTGDSIGAELTKIPITSVPGARLEVSTRIAGPPIAMDGIVGPGGQIQVEAIVINHGQAAIQSGQIIVQTPLPDMQPVENPQRDFIPGIPVLWNISLPDTEVTNAVPVSVLISGSPIDENTNEPAEIMVDSSAVVIFIRELLPQLSVTHFTTHSGSLVKGQQANYFGFDINNADVGSNLGAGLYDFAFGLSCNPAAIASDLLSRALLISGTDTLVADDLTSGMIGFSENDTIYFAPREDRHFELILTINPNTQVSDFTLSIANGWVAAVALENRNYVNRITPTTPGGDAVTWQGLPTAILAQSFSGSISSYPNPFNPRESGTRIGYYLPSSSNLEIRIFTLLGELVWTKQINSSDQFGAAGLHTGESALVWNGKNDAGYEIKSGAYICVIKNLTSGEEERFKIAIVK